MMLLVLRLQLRFVTKIGRAVAMLIMTCPYSLLQVLMKVMDQKGVQVVAQGMPDP